MNDSVVIRTQEDQIFGDVQTATGEVLDVVGGGRINPVNGDRVICADLTAPHVHLVETSDKRAIAMVTGENLLLRSTDS
jgi:hypothetical protein